MTHTSTSPNYQILASLDLGRRQAALEGFELVQKQVEMRDGAARRGGLNHPLLRSYMRCLTAEDLIPPRVPPERDRQPYCGRGLDRNAATAWRTTSSSSTRAG